MITPFIILVLPATGLLAESAMAWMQRRCIHAQAAIVGGLIIAFLFIAPGHFARTEGMIVMLPGWIPCKASFILSKRGLGNPDCYRSVSKGLSAGRAGVRRGQVDAALLGKYLCCREFSRFRWAPVGTRIPDHSMAFAGIADRLVFRGLFAG